MNRTERPTRTTSPARRRLRRFQRDAQAAVHLLYVEIPRGLAGIVRQSLTGQLPVRTANCEDRRVH